MAALPAPFEVYCLDCRPAAAAARPDRGFLRIVQWNVERGYKLQGIIDELRTLDADVIALQEVDWGCERSALVDCGRELATALGLNLAFTAEFEELRSPLRTTETQGGGLHGQALLSRFDLSDVRALVHSHQPVDWEREGESRREPRRGGRVALAATVHSPLGPVLVYSLHLEVFTGITGRLLQFADVLRDCVLPGRPTMQVICGDLNTMAHSVARLSPAYCCDSFRWRSLGWHEARFWAENLFAVTDSAAGFAALSAAAAAASSRRRPPSAPLLLPAGAPNPRMIAWRLPSLVNPGFVDPFCPDDGVSLNNPTYRGLMQGKLDWLLLRGMPAPRAARMGNDDYALSDHKWLLVDVPLSS